MTACRQRPEMAREMAYIALFVALLAVCAWISVPAAVPFTLQTLAVFLAAGLLGGRGAFWAVLTYLALGSMGLPVFAGFTGGFSRLLGPTGGYLVGFLPAVLTTGWLLRPMGKGMGGRLAAMGAGLLICYAFGTAWFLLVYAHTVGPVGLGAVLSWCVLPFLLPDGAKLLLAAALTRRLQPYIKLRQP